MDAGGVRAQCLAGVAVPEVLEAEIQNLVHRILMARVHLYLLQKLDGHEGGGKLSLDVVRDDPLSTLLLVPGYQGPWQGCRRASASASGTQWAQGRRRKYS